MQMYNPYYQPQQMYNPYQRYQQIEQPQIQSAYLNGRVLDSFDMVNVNEIPMDNLGAVFIKTDGTQIMRKQWGNDGTINTRIYSLNTDNPMEKSVTLEDLHAEIKKIREVISRYEPNAVSPRTDEQPQNAKSVNAEPNYERKEQ